MPNSNYRIKFAATLIAIVLIGTTLPSRIAGAQATTLTINPAADAYVTEDASLTNFGNDTYLFLDKNPSAYSFVKFNISGVGSGKVTRAVLRFYAKSDNPKGYDVYTLSSNSWDETSIKYIDAPALSAVLNDSGSVSAGAWNEIDITSSIKGDGTYSFGLASTYGRRTTLSSREDNSHAPQLVLSVSLAEPTATLTTKPTTAQPVSVPTLTPTNSPTGSPNSLLTATAKPTTTQTALPSPTATPIGQPAVQNVTGTFYVSLTGNDANLGTINQPWRTIQKAANTLVAGQTVKILPGIYYEKFSPVNSGNKYGYITYIADPGTVVLDGSNISLSTDYKGDGLIQIQGKSYISVQNLTLRNASTNCVNISENSSGTHSSFIEITGMNILNCSRKGIQVRNTDNVLVKDNKINHITYSSGIAIWYSTYATVDHNTITNAHYYHECQGAYDEALTISGVNHFEVKNNTLDNTEAKPAGFCSTYADKLGIDVKESSQNGQVYGNTVRNMNAGAIYVDGWHAGANGTPTLNRINIFRNWVGEGGGIIVGSEQADGVVEYINIYNNLVVNASFSGIQVRGAWGDGLRKNITIYNNTIYGANPSGGNGGAGIYVTTSHLGSNNGDAPVIIRNNISMFYFLSTGGGTVGQIRAGNSTMASLVTADHNIVYGPQKCSLEYPNCVELGPRISLPASSVFVNSGSFDLHLSPGSQAINTGLTLSTVTFDYDGVARPQGSAYDIGAYEYK